MTLILSNEDIGPLLDMSELIATLESTYLELSEGKGVTRNRSDCITPTKTEGRLYGLKSMDGIVPSLGVGAVRIRSDMLSWPTKQGRQRREKVPAAKKGRWVGLILLFDSETGDPLAICPDGVIQRMRVGATSALGAKHLARPEASTVALIGSGWQAGAQLLGICAVRPNETIRCFSPNAEHRTAFSREMTAQLGVEITPAASPEEAIKGADIVLCATSAIDAVFEEDWLEPGMHVGSIRLPEISFGTLKRADKVFLHARDAVPVHILARGVVVPEKEEGRGWALASAIDLESMPTLIDIIGGKAKGRDTAEQAICFINSQGLGYQFAVAGAIAYRKAVRSGIGNELPTEWFTEDVH
jgi:ornithine cyclodeaminase/alanine dehydrogenase-like protein (mu-crystallin family)